MNLKILILSSEDYFSLVHDLKVLFHILEILRYKLVGSLRKYGQPHINAGLLSPLCSVQCVILIKFTFWVMEWFSTEEKYKEIIYKLHQLFLLFCFMVFFENPTQEKNSIHELTHFPHTLLSHMIA